MHLSFDFARLHLEFNRAGEYGSVEKPWRPPQAEAVEPLLGFPGASSRSVTHAPAEIAGSRRRLRGAAS